MMAARTAARDRFSDLLVARAVEGLDAAGQAELNALSTSFPDVDRDAFDRVAASLALSGLRVEPMPAVLRARIEADAEAWLAGLARRGA